MKLENYIGDILVFKYKGCRFSVGEDYESLDWMDENTPKPTAEDVILADAELSTHREASKYQRLRAAAYPKIEDQLDLIYHGGLAAWICDDRDEDRNPYSGKEHRRDLFARTAHAGGEIGKVAPRMLGERPEAPRRVVGNLVDTAGLERLGKRPRSHHAPHHVDAEPG